MAWPGHRYFCLASYTRAGSYIPPVRFSNLLGHPRELGEPMYLLLVVDHHHGGNSGIAKWKRRVGQGMGMREENFHALSACPVLPNPSSGLNLGALAISWFKSVARPQLPASSLPPLSRGHDSAENANLLTRDLSGHQPPS